MFIITTTTATITICVVIILQFKNFYSLVDSTSQDIKNPNQPFSTLLRSLCNMVPYYKERAQITVVWKQGANENFEIFDLKLKKNAGYHIVTNCIIYVH